MIFYLDAESSGLRDALASDEHVFICVESQEVDTADLPRSRRYTELARAHYSRGDLLLLRAESRQAWDEDAPGSGSTREGSSGEQGDASAAEAP